MGLPGDSGVGKTGCAPFGAALAASHSSSTEVNLAGDALTALEFDSDTLPRPTRGGLPASVPMSALATLTLAALTIALIEKLQAAPSDAVLIDDTIAYKDLEHGTLLIAPKGGATRGIVLDDPELTVVVGPPELGFPVQQNVNSPAEMAILLAASEAVNQTYQLGQADPFTTGSVQRAETHLFFPDSPPIQLASIGLPLLTPLGDNPNNGTGAPEPTGSNAPPPPPTSFTFVIGDDRVLSDDSALPGQAEGGTVANPFLNTAGIGAGTLVVTVEAASPGVDSGLDVTNGGPIFLYTETVNGEQVVVGREGFEGAADDEGDIAFIVSITDDGQTLRVQQLLPIDHSGGGNDVDVLSVTNAALLVHVTVTGGPQNIDQTLPIGSQVAFEDDEPVAQNDTAQVQAQSELASVNALIILDKSGSMGSDGDLTSRISLAKAAILDFASQDNVLSIRILPFDSPADAASAWFDLTSDDGYDDLVEFLDDITGNGGTNYEDAIYQAQQAWTTNPPPPNGADLNNIYFISDGSPANRSNNGINDGNSNPSGSSSGLTSQEKAAWESFLVANEIDNAYAVAINSGVNNADLQEIAFPNTPNETNNVIVLASAGDLSATLQATTFTGTVSGNVLYGEVEPTADDDAFGSDGQGIIKTLRFDSDGDGDVDANDDVYSFNGSVISLNDDPVIGADGEVSFNTHAGGTFTFNFETGDWDYTAPENFDVQFTERFTYTIVDGDGDESAPASLNITVQPPSDQIALYLESVQHTTTV